MDEFDNEPRKSGNPILDTIDGVIEDAGEMIGGARGQKIVGGAALGALAAVVLPVGIVTGAVIGAGYAVWRQANR